MAYQHGKDLVIAYKVEGTYNTAPGATAAKQLRLTGSPGLSLSKALINSAEIRSDGLTSIARHGSQSVAGSYNGELSVGSFDEIFEAAMRSTWVAASGITFDGGAALTSLAANTSGQLGWVGTTTPDVAGVRVGDVIRLTNMSTAANNSINLRVLSLTAASIEVYGTPLTTQGADSACTLTILKKLKNATTPTRRTFYVDQYNSTIDLSEVFGGCRWTGFSIRGTPDGMAEVTFSVVGASSTALATGTSPYYTTPTQYTSIPLVFADATISYAGADIAKATAFDLNYAINAATQPVVGATVSPDVFDNDATLSGSVSMIRQDLTQLGQYINETELELHILLTEPESEPKDCISLYVPLAKLTSATADLGADGAMIETLPWTAGVKPTTTGYDASLLTICTSAA